MFPIISVHPFLATLIHLSPETESEITWLVFGLFTILGVLMAVLGVAQHKLLQVDQRKNVMTGFFLLLLAGLFLLFGGYLAILLGIAVAGLVLWSMAEGVKILIKR